MTSSLGFETILMLTLNRSSAMPVGPRYQVAVLIYLIIAMYTDAFSRLDRPNIHVVRRMGSMLESQRPRKHDPSPRGKAFLPRESRWRKSHHDQ